MRVPDLQRTLRKAGIPGHPERLRAWMPRAVIIGDSRTSQNCKLVTVTSITSSGTTATVSATGHGLMKGQPFFIGGCNESAYNGGFTVLARTDANTFTYTMDSVASASPATGTITCSNQLKLADTSWFQYANARLGSPFYLVQNSGVGGNKAADVLSRIGRDVLALDPDWVFIEIGVNDFTAGNTVASVLSSVQSFYASCRLAGINVVVLTVAPLNSSHASYASAMPLLLEFNYRLRKECLTARGLILVDACAAIIDFTSAGGSSASGMLHTDFIHYAAKGARAVGDAVYTALNGIIPRVNLLPCSKADNYGFNSGISNLLDYSMLTGTAGTLGTSGSSTCTGTVADGMRATMGSSAGSSNTCTANVSRSDAAGYDQQMVIVSNADGDVAELKTLNSMHARISAGDTLMMGAELSVTSVTALKRMICTLQLVADGVTYSIQPLANTDTTFWTSDLTSAVFCSVPFTVPSGFTSITDLSLHWQFVFSGAGGATVKIGRPFLVKMP